VLTFDQFKHLAVTIGLLYQPIRAYFKESLQLQQGRPVRALGDA